MYFTRDDEDVYPVLTGELEGEKIQINFDSMDIDEFDEFCTYINAINQKLRR